MSVDGANSPRAARTAWIVCIIVWCASFIATHTPAKRLPPLPAGDKILHAVAYFILAFVLLVALALSGRRRGRRILTAITAATVYGALDELTQPLVNRFASWGDWRADVLGATAAIVLFEAISAMRKRAQ